MQIEELDKAIGQRLKALRVEAGITQKELAESCGVSSQQIHKYETGLNRLSAGKLVFIANLIERDVMDFYDGLVASVEREYSRADMQAARYFNQITDEKCREALLQLMRQMTS